jgi:hypothetical protein
MWENLTLSKKSLTAVFLTFLVLTGYYTCMGFITPELGSSDQVNVGVMVNKLLQPELYSKDYVFKDNSLFEFYTPIFLHSLSFLQAQTGQFEYALAVYIPMIMLGYLTACLFSSLPLQKTISFPLLWPYSLPSITTPSPVHGGDSMESSM